MSIELPSAWSGSKRIGFAEEEMRTVEIVELASVVADSRVPPRRGDGRTVNVAAALAVPRNLRREMRGVFMGTGKYNGKRIRDFYLLKTSHGFICRLQQHRRAAWLRKHGTAEGGCPHMAIC